MRHCFVLILLITAVSCKKNEQTRRCGDSHPTAFGSIEASKPLFPYLANSVDYSSMERQVPSVQRQQFMDTVYWYNAMYGREGNPDYIHVLDLNADNVSDYLYYGPGPGFDTKEMIAIFKINKSVLSVLGTLKALDFERGVLKRLYVERTMETDLANTKRHISYQLADNNGKLVLKKFFESEMSDATELPTSLYEKYPLKNFCGDSIVLHPTPATSPRPLRSVSTPGLLLGEKIDADHKRWLFVAIAPDEKSLNSSDSLYHVGWVPE